MGKVVSQISGMVNRLKEGERVEREKLDFAVRTLRLHSGNPQALGEKAERSRGRTKWSVPGLTGEGLPTNVQMPFSARDYTVLATDGSHIDVDRHRSAPCYLINIGQVSLTYGKGSDAELGNTPMLYFDESELILPSPEQGQDGVKIEGAILDAKRAVEECRALAGLVKAADINVPVIAMMDGSLVLWDLEKQKHPPYVAETLITNGMLRYLDDIREVSLRSQVALCSYISAPGSSDVVNLLRVALCPHDSPDCRRLCEGRPKAEKECEAVADLRDGAVFAELLRPGERSAVFESHSRVVDNHYGVHRVRFFYLNVCDEIARIEIPKWVADRPELVELAQSLVFDQCALGDGYPVALAEAHEKAVVTTGDREQFWRLVDMVMEGRGMPALNSAKSRSKRRPFV